MRYHSLTKSLFIALLYFGLSSLTGVAFAQVYKSYDANGNVVFSDKPSQRSEEVEIGKPNVTDSFEMPPPSAPADTSLESEPAAPEPEPEPETQPETQPIADEDSADTNNDGRISRREKEEFREEQRRKRREMKEPSGWYSE